MVIFTKQTSFFNFSHGSYECIEWCVEIYQQCWKTRKEAGSLKAVFKGYNQVSYSNDEAW